MKRQSIIVRATWDGVAGLWVADSTDVQGLTAEAQTLEELREKAVAIIPELIELNGQKSELAELPVQLVINPVY